MSRHQRPSRDVSPGRVLPDGPKTFEELDQWAKEMVTQYKGQDVPLPPWLVGVKYLVVTSKWSGCGGMNIAVMKIIEAIKEIFNIEIAVKFHSSCDIDRVCQGLLKTLNCQHLNSDLLDQYDSEVVSKIYHKMMYLQQRLSDFKNSRRTATEKKDMKLKLTAELKAYILLLAPTARWTKTAFCLRHSYGDNIKRCGIVPTLSDGEMWLECVSPNCQPWSRKGLQLGWLGFENLPTIMWSMSLQVFQPHLVALECTGGFDIAFVEALSGRRFETVLLAPHHVGVPMTGERLWAFSAQGSGLSCSPSMFSPTYINRFVRKGVVAGIQDLFCKATVDEQTDYKRHVNTTQARIPCHPRAKEYRWEDCINTGHATRLQQHRIFGSNKRAESPSMFMTNLAWDIKDGPLHHKRPDEGGYLPRPLTNSFMWLEGLERPLLPLELLGAQGLPIYDSAESSAFASIWQWRSKVRQMRYQDQTHVAGCPLEKGRVE